MKKLAVVFLFCCISISIKGQYRKLPLDTNHYWQQIYTRVGSFPSDFYNCVYVLKVRKDSIINGKVFKYVTSQDVECKDFRYYNTSGLIREDTLLRIVTIFEDQKEKILFNLNKNVGDTAKMILQGGIGTYTLAIKDSVLLNDGLFHRRFLYNPNVYGDVIIEGVGGSGGLLNLRTLDFETYNGLLCLAKISPGLSIYNSQGLGKTCPNTTGIFSNSTYKNGLTIYPNPGSDAIKIVSGGLQINSVYIKNILGQTISLLCDINSNSVDLKIADLPNGLYFVNVKTGDLVTTRQLIKN